MSPIAEITVGKHKFPNVEFKKPVTVQMGLNGGNELMLSEEDANLLAICSIPIPFALNLLAPDSNGGVSVEIGGGEAGKMYELKSDEAVRGIEIRTLSV